MWSPARCLLLKSGLTALFLSTTAVSAAAGDLILRCMGTIASFMPSTWTKDDQEIAVHIQGQIISFSGNDLLLGQNIRICKGGDDVYFDSDTCEGKVTTNTRQYGTFNRILRRLILTNTTDKIGLTGNFKCEPGPNR
jgi:hypothetical protein